MEPDRLVSEMSTATARIAYDGELVRTGLMDVRDLAPALLEIGALCERANDILNGERARISVQVRADFKTGSFAIDLEVIQTVIEQVKGVLWGQSVQDAKYLLELLGLTFGGGVLGLYKWLRGRQAKEQSSDNKGVTIVINNNTVVLPREVLILYNDETVRSRIEGTLLPLLKEGIEEFQVRQGPGPEPQVVERVTKIEAVQASEERREAKETPQEEPAHETIAEVPLVIVKPAFREGLKWEVARDSRSAKFSAAMRDLDFLERAERREEQFAVGDILVVDLRSRSYLTPHGLRTEHEILKVKRRLEPPTQQSLFTE
jgi:hypothetical protein